jgi:haloalkane dehalogenase
MPLQITDFPDFIRESVRKALDPEVVEKSLRRLDFFDGFLLSARDFSETEQAYYRKPFLIPGEDRRPMFSFEFSVDGDPLHTAKVVEEYSRWLAQSDIPKLLIRAQPGYLLTNRLLDYARTWPNQREVTVKGNHYIQETIPDEVGKAIADFVRGLRSAG